MCLKVSVWKISRVILKCPFVFTWISPFLLRFSGAPPVLFLFEFLRIFLIAFAVLFSDPVAILLSVFSHIFSYVFGHIFSFFGCVHLGSTPFPCFSSCPAFSILYGIKNKKSALYAGAVFRWCGSIRWWFLALAGVLAVPLLGHNPLRWYCFGLRIAAALLCLF